MAMNRLTPREREIAQLVYDGLSNKEIARRLGISEGTIKTHLHNIFTKLGLANRVMLAMYPWQPFVDYEFKGVRKKTAIKTSNTPDEKMR